VILAEERTHGHELNCGAGSAGICFSSMVYLKGGWRNDRAEAGIVEKDVRDLQLVQNALTASQSG
jgi:hypothetical protein